MNVRHLILSSALLLAACGSDDLSRDAVQTIPDADGVGSALSGTYELEIRTVECRGSCGPFSVGIFSASVCDVGDVDTDRVEVVQTDGHLRIETGELPSLFEGGAYADGSFDVGGYATQSGGALEITARSIGQLRDDELTATVESRTWGNVEGQGADCYGLREVSGTRDD